MQGVRWTDDQLEAYRARRANLRVVPPAGAVVSADAERIPAGRPAAPACARAKSGAGPGAEGAQALGKSSAVAGALVLPKARIKRPEQVLQIAAIDFLDVALDPSWRVFHVPNGGARSAVEASIFKAMGVRPGVGDLAFVGRGGRFVGAEAKAGRNGLTDDQAEWRDWCLANAIPWFLFRSIDELVSGCTDAGVKLRVRA